MKFIDLFAGLGGFHIALNSLGHECVFASEIKGSLAELYYKNYGIVPRGDIRMVKVEEIPAHDILCAGFPCQPFSKAGRQMGLKDKENGDMFSEIVRILEKHHPSYFILENVQHLANHDNEYTLNHMYSTLHKKLGYHVQGEVFSPHDFNIPQHRKRLFIVGSKSPLDYFKWPKKLDLTANVSSLLDNNPSDANTLEPEKSMVLDIWQEFIDRIPKNDKLPSFPIWAMEYGATYPFEKTTPFFSSSSLLGRSRGSFGTPLKGMDANEKLQHLPSYARSKEEKFPSWKIRYIQSNRLFFEKYKTRLAPVIRKIEEFDTPSWQKLEWNIQGGERQVRDYVIQFRGSGIRLKRRDYFPSLVCVSTQIPIIGWEERYLTKIEGARLQGMDSIKLPDSESQCFDALGNAVNTNVVRLIAANLLESTTRQEVQIDGPNEIPLKEVYETA